MATTTQTSALPSWLQDLMQTAGNRGLGIANTPFQTYPGQQVAGFAPEQEAALQMQAARATAGSPLMAGGQQLLGQTIGGNFLQGNPYLQGIIDTTNQSVAGQVNKAMRPGAFGGSVNQELLTRNLANSENQLRYGAYNDERTRQMQALGMAPTYAANDFTDASKLFEAGQQRQGLNQQIADANRAEFLRAQEWPFKTQQAFVGSLGLNPGQSITQQTPDPSKLSGVLGGGLVGAGLGGLLAGNEGLFGFSPNQVKLGGAALGGLLGLL